MKTEDMLRYYVVNLYGYVVDFAVPFQSTEASILMFRKPYQVRLFDGIGKVCPCACLQAQPVFEHMWKGL